MCRVAVLYLHNIPMYTTNIISNSEKLLKNNLILLHSDTDTKHWLLSLCMCETALSEKPQWWRWIQMSNSTRRLATIFEVPFSFQRPIWGAATLVAPSETCGPQPDSGRPTIRPSRRCQPAAPGRRFTAPSLMIRGVRSVRRTRFYWCFECMYRVRPTKITVRHQNRT